MVLIFSVFCRRIIITSVSMMIFLLAVSGVRALRFVIIRIFLSWLISVAAFLTGIRFQSIISSFFLVT